MFRLWQGFKFEVLLQLPATQQLQLLQQQHLVLIPPCSDCFQVSHNAAGFCCCTAPAGTPPYVDSGSS
jgi:hypothetical protein